MKLTKEDVYVKVTTLEESQELLKVLTESGEEVNSSTALGLNTGFDDDGDSQLDYPYITFVNHKWYGFKKANGSKVKASIPQLKEILNPMTLEKALSELESLKGKIEGLIKQQAESDKKEIQLNKWYKSNVSTITFVTDNKTYYGFDWAGNWSNNVIEKKSFKNHFDLGKWDLMDDKEVEQALIKEAENRGFKYYNYIFDERTNILWGNDEQTDTEVFSNGKWNDVTFVNRTKLDTDIEALKDKYKDFKITVIVE